MSVLQSTEEGWILSHLEFINKMYEKVINKSESEKHFSLQFNKTLFDINSVFLRQNQVKNVCSNGSSVSHRRTRKRKKSNLLPAHFLTEINYVKEKWEKLMKSPEIQNIFSKSVISDNNEAARLMSRNFYSDSVIKKEFMMEGSHWNEVSSVSQIDDQEFVFPKYCQYFCRDVRELDQKLPLKNQFDFVLMDPPWWNKSIRRKKEMFVESSYKMMYNEELAKLPIGKLLSTKGLVAIWCTNSPSSLHCILEEMFPVWGVKFQAKWYWVKVTQSGNVVCNFNETHGKQPYELLIIGTKDSNREIPNGKIIVSVPSAMHSHKPPLTEIIAKFLPSEPKCLEIFSRYLLPNWVSWGFEALKFQHISFFSRPDKKIKEEDEKVYYSREFRDFMK
ncbi:N(6)-adenine-specific DNA methyltransferase METTL4 isoform X2 [Belonocnema kinseyi]|uniref:N(6)-adenine-specific DNA methyltransferase METTL4 isoform X2 n=1 Tax=Belonocnema kinseyi TaxID=2817044 RepID=UPI00143DE1E7|nr:N(6)-adenine-specific DNA methyltransferase METTL4 isoform X2 [Belonocnema kinseyi]